MIAETDDALRQRKAIQRKERLAARDALTAAERAAAAQALAHESFFAVPYGPGNIISAFWPINAEMDVMPLLRRLVDGGARLALPLMVGKGEPLSMRLWELGAPLKEGVWGIREPFADAREIDPDILLVPLAAFDRRGGRIGYGAGYYDRTIATLRQRKAIATIGIAYAVQEVPEVAMGPQDERLDFIMTERETIECGDEG